MKRFVPTAVIFLLFLFGKGFASAADTLSGDTPDNSTDIGQPAHGRTGDLYLFPGTRLKYEAARYFPNTMDFSAETTGSVGIDIVRFRRFSFSFLMRERNIYGGRGIPWYTPWTIKYVPVEMAHLKWDSGYGYLGLVVDHECDNAINRDIPELKRYRWYGIALKWQSYGMDPDVRDYYSEGSRAFSFIGKPAYAVYIGRRIKTVAYPYRYMMQWDLRYDIMRLFNLVPYARTSGAVIFATTTRVNRAFEIGVMYLFDRVIVSPYVRYSYRHDIDRYNGTAARFWTVGLSSETKIDVTDPRNDGIGGGKDHSGTILLFPGMHFTGSYGRHYRNRLIGNDAYSNISLNVISLGGMTSYIENELNHNSPAPSYYLFPKYIDYSNRAGISAGPVRNIAVVSVEYSFNQRHIGDFYNPSPEKHHAMEFRVESPGLHRDTRYEYIRGISSADGFINDLLWRFDIRRNFRGKNSPYTWQAHGALEWEILSFAGFVPYISPDITWLHGRRNDTNWSIESGVNFCSGIIAGFFCRYEDQALLSGIASVREKSVYCGVRFSR